MQVSEDDLYQTDALDVPTYTVAEAARFLRLHQSTLHIWVYGCQYSTQEGQRFAKPLIELTGEGKHLSFTNLVEAHVLRALRRAKGITLPHIREAIDVVRTQSGIERPLSDPDLRARYRKLLLGRYAQLFDISPRIQFVVRAILDEHTRRVGWNKDGTLRRLYPFVWAHPGPPAANEPKIVVIDPRIGFGRPTIAEGIRTSTINERFTAGESILELAEDCGCHQQEIEEAIRYENGGRPYRDCG
jgi:uncharacterized protein (DUF433 family)